MTSEVFRLSYGDQLIEFILVRRDRKTLAINVHPDQKVEVVAPLTATLESIFEKVHKRAPWVRQQIQYFEQFQPRTPPRVYVAGETYRYLGRQYKLKISRGIQNSVKMQRGQIIVSTTKPQQSDQTRELVREWFLKRAKIKFAERLLISQDRFPDPKQMAPNNLLVRELSHRWGSMTAKRNLVLNRSLIGASTEAIDYVITHELCHIEYLHHGPEFYDLLRRVMPDWETRKAKLERQMA